MSKINGEIAVLPKETHLRAIHYTGDNLEDILRIAKQVVPEQNFENCADNLYRRVSLHYEWVVFSHTYFTKSPMLIICTDKEFKLRFQVVEQSWGLHDPICGYWIHSDGNYRECPSFPYWNEKQAVEDAKLLDRNPGGREVEVVSEWFRIGSDEN